MYCSKCGQQIVDGEYYCANCGAPVTRKDAFEPYGQRTYGDPAQSQQPYQQSYQQPIADPYKAQQDISTSRLLGIISIVLGALGGSVFGWICGGIGLSIANRYLFSNNIQIRASAQEAKKLNKIGLIVSSVIFALALVFAIIMFAVTFGLVSTYSYF